MKVKTLVVGLMQANCYILECEETHNCVIIDPGGDAERILNYIKVNELTPTYIINTHGHIDHIAANNEIKGAGIKNSQPLLCIHEADADMIVNPQKNLSFLIGENFRSVKPDKLLHDGDTIASGTISLTVIHTPGHSPGSICLLASEYIFTGDLLFAGSIGRYDFPGSSYTSLLNSLKKVMTLRDDVIVFPGHGPSTTIGEERIYNPFMDLL